jgi:hypothetical protein
MKRVLVSLAWTSGAYIGSSLLLGFLSGIIFFTMAMFQYDPSVHHTLIAAVSQVVPAVVAVVFLVLAVRRRLPGTRCL